MGPPTKEVTYLKHGFTSEKYEYSDYQYSEYLSAVESVLYKLNTDGLHVTASSDGAGVYLYGEFADFEFPKYVQSALLTLDCDNESGYSLKANPITLHSLIDDFGGLSRSLKRIRGFTNSLELEVTEGLCSEQVKKATLHKFFETIYTSLTLIQQLLNKKNIRREGKSYLKQKFCVFCWRTVRTKTKGQNSSYYCPSHHPESKGDGYTKSVRAIRTYIIASGDKASIDSLELYKGNGKKGDLPRLYNRCFSSIPLRLDYGALAKGSSANECLKNLVKQIQTDWESAAYFIIFGIKGVYPHAFVKIKNSMSKANSWRHWLIHGVISSLSEPRDNEVELWSENEELTMPENVTVILNVLRRYQSTVYLNETINPIGKKPTKKNKVKDYVLQYYLEHGIEPNNKELINLFDTNRNLIAQVKRTLKEEGHIL
jgi:hypothetical protein